MQPSLPTPPSLASWKVRASADLGMETLASASGIAAQVSGCGALFSLRCGRVMINQVLPFPAEDGLFRLLLRWRAPDGTAGWAPLVGPTVAHRRTGALSHAWESSPAPGLDCAAVLSLHPASAAWRWSVTLTNRGGAPYAAEVFHAQDLGLGDEAAVRNNEAFTSQYIDLLPVHDAALGWTVLARQNQAAAEGAHPWLSVACVPGAVAFATDATQFFGTDHRLVQVPAAVRSPRLPSVRLQYESALAGLQSPLLTVAPGGTAAAAFVARFSPDHPQASSAADLEPLRRLAAEPWPSEPARPAPLQPAAPSLFVTAPLAAGAPASAADWDAWFGGGRRHEERAADGELLAFFSGNDRHVVAREKEATLARPHGHILRGGSWKWVDNEQFGATCYAAGVFGVQAYLGNPTFGRLLPVVRDTLGIGRAAGQRVFLRSAGAWQQLGIPSAFCMTPADVRWIYRLADRVVEVRVWCSAALAASFLDVRLLEGMPPEGWLVAHTLALGPNEMDQGGEVRVHAADLWAACIPAADSLMALRLPGTCYAVAPAEPCQAPEMGDDALLFADGASRGHACVCLRYGAVPRLGVILGGSLEGEAALAAAVRAARLEWAGAVPAAEPPAPPVRLALSGAPLQAPVARLDEMLPWLAHNAGIHFAAPHGLEQQGGAAWGVRDVCQGSVEWLLAAGDWPAVRRILETVFAQQYARDGSWPQWFMHPPFQSIQHAHSHGDVCFWPVKALCDYAEASNDLGFLGRRVPYTDPVTFVHAGPNETLLEHCDRMLAQCEARFVPGTALVNYGDGDWDDTLQPADPAMRTKMISAWTVALSFHTFRQYAAVLRRAGDGARAARVEALLARIRADFAARLMPDGVTAGFLVTEADGSSRALIHPSDTVTRIRYRLLPMTRSVLAELFTAEEARRHMAIVEREMVYPDGARLMSEPAAYRGGLEHLFKRADTAANVGREIGLLYVHAHLRYAEALARLGDASAFWTALQVVNPVGLGRVVPHAADRQSNVYFSSSDADFNDRVEAARRWTQLKGAAVAVRGGWRLYSSGPGLFLHIVRASLLGLRESFDEVVIDPVMPRELDGLSAACRLCDRPVTLRYRVRAGTFGPISLAVNGVPLASTRREPNPYRVGGLCFSRDALAAALGNEGNVLEISL